MQFMINPEMRFQTLRAGATDPQRLSPTVVDADKLASYAGLAPVTRQSGKSINGGRDHRAGGTTTV